MMPSLPQRACEITPQNLLAPVPIRSRALGKSPGASIFLGAIMEEWRDVVGYEGLYEVSNKGQVKRSPRAPKRTRSIPGKTLKATLTPLDYYRIELSRDGKAKKHYVHCLVAAAFNGPCPPGFQCCHWDGVPTNNCPTNLRWGSITDNAADRKRHGKYTGNPKLTEQQVLEIRATYKRSWGRRIELAQKYGVTVHAIAAVIQFSNWKHLKMAGLPVLPPEKR